jgi:subtilisin family serine protease
MKNFLLVLFSMLISIPTFAVGGEQEYIIKFKNNIQQKSLFDLHSAKYLIKSFIYDLNMTVVKSSDANAIQHLKGLLGNDVEYIVPNKKVYLYADTVTAAKTPKKEGSELWGMKAIHAPEAWGVTMGSRDVVLAISDTGTWFDHNDLKNNLWVNKGEMGKDAKGKDKHKNKVDDDGNGYIDDLYGYNFETNTGNPLDNHYHGTHVAGTIGADGTNNSGIGGVSQLVSIMTAKFLGMDGSGTDEGAVNTIIYAAKNGAKALNCSWGDSEYSQAIDDAIQFAQDKGMLVVVAAGNDGHNNDKNMSFPANSTHENVITVTSADAKGELSYFSNWSKTLVDIAAPGENIYSTWNPMQSPLRRDWYYEISGTSMATPHVTGTIGLMYAANPKLTWRDVKNILLSTATPMPKLKDKVSSGGYLNAFEAVKAAKAFVTP